MRQKAHEIWPKLSYRGLNRLGDILLPPSDTFPAFSATGCATYVTEIYRVSTPKDANALEVLFIFFNFFPKGVLRWFFSFLNWISLKHWRFAIPFRKLWIGLRGVVFSLYYSNLTIPEYEGPRVYDAIHFELTEKKP